jgi:hypothetical protein
MISYDIKSSKTADTLSCKTDMWMLKIQSEVYGKFQGICDHCYKIFHKSQVIFFSKPKIILCFFTKFLIHNLCIQPINFHIEILQKSDIIVRKEINF